MASFDAALKRWQACPAPFDDGHQAFRGFVGGFLDKEVVPFRDQSREGRRRREEIIGRSLGV